MSSDPKATRGYRNRNPGNIDYLPPGRAWNGQVGMGDEWLPEDRRRFGQYESHAMGIRALAGQLVVYQTRHGLRTIEGMISRWAPSNENDTGAYVRFVADRVGASPKATVDARRHAVAFPLVKAVIHKELGGMPYTDAEINEGLALYGITPAAQEAVPTIAAAAQTGTGQGAITAASVTAAAGVAAPVLSALGGLPEWTGVALVLVAGAAVVAWILTRRKAAAS